jgi:cadmium resistance protein CadD (predicted permease)
LALLAFVYFPPVTAVIKERFSYAIPAIAKIILGIFILWASLGVGELVSIR